MHTATPGLVQKMQCHLEMLKKIQFSLNVCELLFDAKSCVIHTPFPAITHERIRHLETEEVSRIMDRERHSKSLEISLLSF